jgi:hypothetical protein
MIPSISNTYQLQYPSNPVVVGGGVGGVIGVVGNTGLGVVGFGVVGDTGLRVVGFGVVGDTGLRVGFGVVGDTGLRVVGLRVGVLVLDVKTLFAQVAGILDWTAYG